MNVLVDSIPTYYRDEGNGRVILMLHGWGSDLSTFSNLAIWAKDKYRVVRMDLPGFGKTPFVSKESWQLDNYVDFINNFLKKIEIDKVDIIIGHSMGGRIAIKGVGNNALKTEKLILLAAHGLSDRSLKKFAFMLIAKVGKAATLLLPTKQRKKLRKRLYKSADASDYLDVSQNMKGTFRNIINEDLKDSAARIKVPAMLIYGTDDKVTPLKMGEVFAEEIDGSILRVIKGAGHYIHNDTFGKVTSAISEFIK